MGHHHERHHHEQYHETHRGAYEDFHRAPHGAKLSHELIAGAAAYEAMKAYNDHVARTGHPASHAKAKEIIAALAGMYVDRMIETKGLDKYDEYRDRRRLKHHAEGRGHSFIEQMYRY
ncbi:hypothetical protein F5J12DRAFT_292665 [Pisolithus orientalis]|uniref:CipC-like antibiotic response protein n=1 Tax=Pisolithus tinctorius Marx 270 TaxID=870435 RepID=A0A0C3NWT5_PISTI|nr:uncharacterized protein F5J12DRAFT_292665 [Pisolithus orientalis]KAI6030444.1 hypothetical protein F5J12DRAFT_292665 [Pisolithus orientalis]KAI6139360.1 hypothetical protein BKA82DRAFT_999923 [Pisolithus tinctorius]KIO05320.1 hypothetical protein M404DRAFT_999923 [Pisolithus tinctorius Marx 270]